MLFQFVVRLLEALGHLVEAPRQLADLTGAFLAEADRKVAGSELARALCRLAHRPGDDPREVEAEEQDQDCRSRQTKSAELDRVPRLRICRALALGRDRVLYREESL